MKAELALLSLRADPCWNSRSSALLIRCAEYSDVSECYCCGHRMEKATDLSSENLETTRVG